MPPKVPSGRGRGRGRGRGASSGTTRSSTPATAAATTIAGDQDTPASSSSASAPVAQMTAGAAAPVAQMSTTATPSTTTAAPTPSIARVASVRRGGASASPAPSSSRGKKPVIPAPRAVRRSKEDREAIQKEVNAKKAEEARAALREAKKAGRGRGDRGRGRGGKARGGFMGDSERTIREVVASGPFSAGQVSAEGSYRSRRPVGGFTGGGGGGGGGGYGGGGRGGGGGGGGGSSSSGGGTRIKSEGGPPYGGFQPEDGGYISSDLDEADEGPRRNIDFIDLVSDDDDATTHNPMAPIRVNRVEHREREKPVAADTNKSKQVLEPVKSATGEYKTSGDAAVAERPGSPEASRTAGKQRAKEVQVVRSERKWKGAWEDSDDDLAIKPEPQDEDGAITADPLVLKQSASPETRRKKGKTAVRPRHGLPTEAPALQTQEERREWERHHLDLEILRQELGEIVLPPAPSTADPTPKDAQGDTKMTGETEEEQEEGETQGATSLPSPQTAPPPQTDRRADRVYLFQFPPILPSLSSVPLKNEPASPTLSRKIPSSTTHQPIDLSTSAPAAPTDNSKQTDVKPDPNVPESAGQSHSPFPAGLVGKLRVHASGRTTLDWGGTALQVGMGTDVQFLQDAVVAKFHDQALDVEGGSGGKGKEAEVDENRFGGEVMGLGQVRGKFVVTPDWEEIVGVRI